MPGNPGGTGRPRLVPAGVAALMGLVAVTACGAPAHRSAAPAGAARSATGAPGTVAPATTAAPTAAGPTTAAPTAAGPTTVSTTTVSTTTHRPTTVAPTTAAATTVPATGAPAQTQPAATVASTAGHPASLAPLVAPAEPGEGVWQPAPGSATAGRYAVYTTELRAAPGAAPSGLAWIDPSITRLALYAGTAEPSGVWAQQGYVAPAAQPGLIAAFNSGFKMYAYGTGWYAEGRTAVPLRSGAASLVILADGSATVGEWGVDVGAGPQVVAVRQNLHLLVDHGAPAPDAGVVGDWGATLGGVSATWRSGVGVTAAGDLVYAGGPYLLPGDLARLLIDAGAVRAMELDINPEWVSFATFTHAGAGPSGPITGSANLASGMYFSPGHYLQPFSRDFFAVLRR